MPQPLSMVRKDARLSYGGMDALLQRPALAPYVAQTICDWSSTECLISHLLASILQTESDAVSNAYLEMTNSDSRRAFLTEVGKSSLTGESLAAFNDVMKALKAPRDRRNSFAHDVWAISEDLPDALLLIENKVQARTQALVGHVMNTKIGEGGVLENPNIAQKLIGLGGGKDRIMVYRETDMKQSREMCKQAHQCVSLLSLLLQQEGKGLGKHGFLKAIPARQLLYQVPLIVQILQPASSETPDE